MLFDQGGTANSRNFVHARVHRRPVHRTLAFNIPQVHRLVHYLLILSVLFLVIFGYRLE
jgi:hypothetical protein